MEAESDRGEWCVVKRERHSAEGRVGACGIGVDDQPGMRRCVVDLVPGWSGNLLHRVVSPEGEAIHAGNAVRVRYHISKSCGSLLESERHAREGCTPLGRGLGDLDRPVLLVV